MSIQFHERLQRGAAAIDAMARFPVAICGAGALGANIAEGLARAGFARLVVIDRDRIEERNLSTQPYYRTDIGAFKAKIVGHALYRAVGARVDAYAKELTGINVAKLLDGTGLVIDTFDNSASRGIVAGWCAERDVPCLHAGLADGYAEVIWNEIYRVPSPARDDICDYPLARNLAMLAAAVACETAIGFVTKGERRSYTITLGDLAVRPYEGGPHVRDLSLRSG